MTILNLTASHSAGRRVQAEKCYKEARRLGLKDQDILEEIGDLYSRDEATVSLAIDAYTHLTNVNPQNGEGWNKLADTLTVIDRSKAIDAYKQAIELVEGEGIRSKIALTLQELLTAEGRYEEVEPFKKYLTQAGINGPDGMNSSFAN